MVNLDPVALDDPHVPAHNEERDAINALQQQVNGKISLPPGAATGDLLRWDGTQWLTTETRFLEGNGSPNGSVSAPVGSRYVDMSASGGSVEWVKRSGGGGNTGWITLLGDSGWVEIGSSGAPAFQNSWTNFGGGYATAAYRKINGIVYLKGLLNRTAARNVIVFYLPSGFRPSGGLLFSTNTSGNVNSEAQGVAITASNGAVTGRSASSGFLGLDGVSFVADS